jgi:hypothetical protein
MGGIKLLRTKMPNRIGVTADFGNIADESWQDEKA